MIQFESFRDEHRVAVVDIFNHYVLNTTYAYRSEPLSYAQFDLFLENAEKMCGYAVVDDGAVIGLCQLKPYREMSTFDKTAELTYFLEPGSTGKGFGALILNRLTEEAKRRGKDTLLASLSGENRPSYRFHQKHGFVECARLANVGEKFGRRFDVVYMQKVLDQMPTSTPRGAP